MCWQSKHRLYPGRGTCASEKEKQNSREKPSQIFPIGKHCPAFIVRAIELAPTLSQLLLSVFSSVSTASSS